VQSLVRVRQMAASLLMVLTVAACEGAEGPAGPVGPQGPTGPQGLAGPAGAPGAANRIVLSAVSVGATVSVTLPPAVGNSPTSPPLMACYLASNPAGGVWLAVNDGYSSTSPWCAVSLIDGAWVARMFNAPSTWTAAFVVVF
jgi:hypothetical protein